MLQLPEEPKARLASKVIWKAWAEGLTPPPTLSIAEWADRYRWVAAPSPEIGWWRNARTPYLTGIMDCISPIHPAREIGLMKATQMGGTEVLVNTIAFFSHLAPTTGMIVLPTKDVAEEWSKIRFEALFESSPALHGLLQTTRARHASNNRNSIFLKKLTGGRGSWKLAWSSSGRVLRSTPAEVVICDEVDAFDLEVKGEGEPVEILRKRFANYPRGKIILCSSPTTKSQSRIERAFQEGDQRYFFVPCPECSWFQRLIFPNLHSDSLGPYFECISCKSRIREHRKAKMLAAGKWIATKDHPNLRDQGFARNFSTAVIEAQMWKAINVSFHLPAFIAPYGWTGASWPVLLHDWEKMKSDPVKRRVFFNTVLGETWTDESESLDWEKLKSHQEPYSPGVIPRAGLLLTMAADVQADRIEVEVKAWGRKKNQWSIWYEIVQGGPDDQKAWDRLALLLNYDWPHESGATIPITLLAIDSNYRPEKVYPFVKSYPQLSYGNFGATAYTHRSAVAIRGNPHEGSNATKLISSITAIDAARKKTGVRVISVNTSYAKTQLYSFFKLQPPSDPSLPYPYGYCHFPTQPEWYSNMYFQGLVSESKVVTKTGKVEWVRDPAIRNEPLDLAVYNLVAAHLCGVDSYREEHWSKLEARILEKVIKAENQKPPEQPEQTEQPEQPKKTEHPDPLPVLTEESDSIASASIDQGEQAKEEEPVEVVEASTSTIPPPISPSFPPLPTPPPPQRFQPPTSPRRPPFIRGRFRF